MTGIYRQERENKLTDCNILHLLGGGDMGVHTGKKKPTELCTEGPFGLLHTCFSVQFSHSVMSNFLQPHRLQHARPPCSSPTPGVYSNSCPLSRWHHPAISSSVVPFSSCLILIFQTASPSDVSYYHHLLIISHCLDTAYYSNPELSNNGTANLNFCTKYILLVIRIEAV